MGGAGPLIGTTFAVFLGQSLGDFLGADLGKTDSPWSIRLELRAAPAPKLNAGGEESVEFEAPTEAPGSPASAVLKFGMMKELEGWLENSINASEEQRDRNEPGVT